MDYEHILYDVADRVLTITLNRPERLNAVTDRTISELLDALDRADRDDDVRAIIFTGAGRGYCAGADLSERSQTMSDTASTQAADVETHRDGGGLVTLRLFDCLVRGAKLWVALHFSLAPIRPHRLSTSCAAANHPVRPKPCRA